MDTLTIKGMQFRGFHGVHEHEKKEGNDFEVDVIFEADLSAPGYSDKLKYAIDYTTVYDIARDIMEGESRDLIEHLCFQIGQKVFAAVSKQARFEVAVRKLAPPLDSPVKYTEARMTWPR